MAATYLGPMGDWELTRDDEGRREYTISHKVLVDLGDGPATALACSGLPQPGDSWAIQNDVDQWVWCQLGASVKPFATNDEKTRIFLVKQKFANRTPQTCVQNQIDNPLLKPQQVSGSTIKYQEEATHDRFGYALINSAFEQIRGPQVEFDKNRARVKIVQNVANLDLALCNSMIDTVNIQPLWGLPRRCIKLSDFNWEAQYYGTCLRYYVRTFDFETSYRIDPLTGLTRSGFDRQLLDEGSKALHGKWNSDGDWELIDINGSTPNPMNPAHYSQYKDRNSENSHCILDGAGKPYNPGLDRSARWWCLIGSRVLRIGIEDQIEYDTICLNATCVDAYARLEEVSVDGWVYVLFGPMKDQDNCNDSCFEDDFFADFTGGDPAALFMKNLAAKCSSPGWRNVEYYTESNFLLLGVPLDF